MAATMPPDLMAGGAGREGRQLQSAPGGLEALPETAAEGEAEVRCSKRGACMLLCTYLSHTAGTVDSPLSHRNVSFCTEG